MVPNRSATPANLQPREQFLKSEVVEIIMFVREQHRKAEEQHRKVEEQHRKAEEQHRKVEEELVKFLGKYFVETQSRHETGYCRLTRGENKSVSTTSIYQQQKQHIRAGLKYISIHAHVETIKLAMIFKAGWLTPLDRKFDNILFTYLALVKKFENLYSVGDATRNAFRVIAKNKKPVHQNHLRVLFVAGVRTARKLLDQNIWPQVKERNYHCWVRFAGDKLKTSCKTDHSWIKPFYYMDKKYARMVVCSTEASSKDVDQSEAMGATAERCQEKLALFKK